MVVDGATTRVREARAGVQLTLLSRSYCHLCDEMRAALEPIAAAFGANVDEIDVDAHPALEARYGELVPVLLQGPPQQGVELCRHRLDAGAVRKALERACAA